MMQTMSSPQLAELEAFWHLEGGWGDYKQDYRFGQLCSIHANINRDKKKQPKPFTAADFAMRPKLNIEPSKDAADRIKANMEMFSGVKPGKKKKRRR